MHNVSLAKLHEIIGADAVPYITLEEFALEAIAVDEVGSEATDATVHSSVKNLRAPGGKTSSGDLCGTCVRIHGVEHTGPECDHSRTRNSTTIDFLEAIS